MLTDGVQHPLVLWWICVGIPLTILATWGVVAVFRELSSRQR